MPRSKSRLLRWASCRGRPPRCTRQVTDTTLPFLQLLRSVGGDRTREAASRGRLRLFPLRDDHRSNELPLHPGSHLRGGDTIFGGFASTPISLALTLPGGGLS